METPSGDVNPQNATEVIYRELRICPEYPRMSGGQRLPVELFAQARGFQPPHSARVSVSESGVPQSTERLNLRHRQVPARHYPRGVSTRMRSNQSVCAGSLDFGWRQKLTIHFIFQERIL